MQAAWYRAPEIETETVKLFLREFSLQIP
jgi:hypothetical protein